MARRPGKSHQDKRKGPKKKPKWDSSRSDRSEPKPGQRTEFIEAALKATKVRLTDWIAQSDKLKATPYVPPKDPADELDDWQRDALDGLLQDENVIVNAPTTAGKTRVVEAYFSLGLKGEDSSKFRACYTCPVRSLANDKFREFRAMFGEENVGLATGDIKVRLDAPIVVATLETYRNSLLGVEPDMGRSLVVFDEYHFIQDSGRGSAWEEAIILTPGHCRILMLSASLANPRDFQGWIEKLHQKPCKYVEVARRPVPLADLVYVAGHWVLAEEVPKHMFRRLTRDSLRPLPAASLVSRLVGLPEMGLTPSIVYSGRRLGCEILAEECARQFPPLSKEHGDRIQECLNASDQELKVFAHMPTSLRRMIMRYGVAFHHSGLATPVRIAVETLVKKGLLKICTATMGLSLGINFSVKSVVISDFSRPGEQGFTKYCSSELLQMLGRAGRRGMDPVGFSLWPGTDYYSAMAKPEKEDALSNLKHDPITFLGLLGRNYSLTRLEDFYKKSFLSYKKLFQDFSLLHKRRIQKKLGVGSIPCSSAAGEYLLAKAKKKSSLCFSCEVKDPCHKYLRQKSEPGTLSGMHFHLHKMGAISREEKLTELGETARFVPQGGGLLVARMIHDGRIREDNLLASVQLFAALSTASYKSPEPKKAYKFPWNEKEIIKELEQLYPIDIFPELYDFSNRHPRPIIKDFCPDAGYVVAEWLKGTPWPELVASCNRGKSVGDIMAIIYRTASYLQSIGQARVASVSAATRPVRDELLKDPLSIVI